MPFSLAALLTLIQRLSRIKVLGNIGENSLSNLFANGSLIEQGNQSLAANDPAAGELTREDPILLAASDILRDREVMRFQTQPPHALCIPRRQIHQPPLPAFRQYCSVLIDWIRVIPEFLVERRVLSDYI